MKREDVDINKVTPMMRQYLEIKDKNKDIIIFFRLGDFYEMFFEDAITASRELELTLTGKSAGLDEKIPMCGIPYHASSIYINKMVSKGYRIGIVEQIEDPKLVTRGIVKRDVVKLISSGTIIDTDSLNEKDNNYLGSIIDAANAYILSYCDITTGILYTEIIEHDKSKLVSSIISNNIKELIVRDSLDKSINSILKNQFKIDVNIYENDNRLDEYSYLYSDIKDERCTLGINYLLNYIIDMQKQSLSHFQKAILKNSNNYLKMDIHTKRNLELTETLRLKQRNFSLIWLLDKTKTAMGSRLLKNYIENPLVDKDKINYRYDMVSKLLDEFILKSDLINLLDYVYDLERLSGKIAFKNASGRDMLQLKASLKVLPDINNILQSLGYEKELPDVNSLYNLLEESIYENPPLTLKEGYLIKDGFNSELDELKELRKGGKDFVARFEAEEKERTGIKNLRVGYNRVFGYYIEISKGNINLIKDEYGYERRQTLSNCERYISPVLKEKESLILNAEEKIIDLEYFLFNEIREKAKEYIKVLQDISKIISEIDVLQAFATVTEENNYVRPIISDDRVVSIKNNRHPVVEKVINGEYVPNDIEFNKDTNILLITGPNMAGKSTYMRQFAITVIMAQIGCFVPASSARIPIFDAIYTRIGASDDLVSGESTFMVEMIEANNAISNASENSLILFDELGRGTATFDGMALAQAIIEYIANIIKCKTLFSTHYHELTDLENTLDGVRNIHVSAKEDGGNITFLHKIEPGSIDKSYGIHVAKLANINDSIIKRADSILKIYEGKEKKRDLIIQESLPLDEIIDNKSVVEEKIKALNLVEVTPLEALNFLFELKKDIK